jgi:hypothetical protein
MNTTASLVYVGICLACGSLFGGWATKGMAHRDEMVRFLASVVGCAASFYIGFQSVGYIELATGARVVALCGRRLQVLSHSAACIVRQRQTPSLKRGQKGPNASRGLGCSRLLAIV